MLWYIQIHVVSIWEGQRGKISCWLSTVLELCRLALNLSFTLELPGANHFQAMIAYPHVSKAPQQALCNALLDLQLDIVRSSATNSTIHWYLNNLKDLSMRSQIKLVVWQKESILQTTMVSIIDAGNVSWVGSSPSWSEPFSWDQSVLCHDRDQYRYSRKGTALQPLLNIEGYGYELRTRVFHQLCGHHIEYGDDGPHTRLGTWLNTNYSTKIFRNKIPAAVTGGKGDFPLTTTSFLCRQHATSEKPSEGQKLLYELTRIRCRSGDLSQPES